MLKTVKKFFLVIILIFAFCSFNNALAQEQAKVLEGKASFDWIIKTQDEREQKIEEIRDLIFSEGTVLKYDKKVFRAQNEKYWKNSTYLTDYELIKAGVREDNGRELCGFYWKNLLIAYGIQYKNEPEHVFYYDSLGNLRWLDKVSSAYPKYPYWSYQYDKNGRLVAVYYNLSGDDQYVYTPDRVFQGRWYKENLYDKNAKIVMTRSVW